MIVGATRNNRIGSMWKWMTDGVPRLAAHNQAMAHGDCFEMVEVFRDIPGNDIGVAYHSVLSHGNNDIYFRKGHNEEG